MLEDLDDQRGRALGIERHPLVVGQAQELDAPHRVDGDLGGEQDLVRIALRQDALQERVDHVVERVDDELTRSS